MLGIITKSLDKVQNKDIYFVSISEKISNNEALVKMNFSRIAKAFAEQNNVSKVYLLYGKEKIIEYDFKI